MSDEKDKIKITIPEYSGEEFAPDAAPSNEPAAPVEEIKKAEKILTDNDEIAAFNKEVLGELELPLFIRKFSANLNLRLLYIKRAIPHTITTIIPFLK